jgi:AraC family transcriptional regulator of adaptative response/methylated-DNA-[protein]-cysteine methyltransferase
MTTSVRYAVAPCPLGWLLIAATSRGICAIDLGDTPEALLERVRLLDPLAEPSDDSVITAWLTALVSLIEQPTQPGQLPLDVLGSPLQRRVWTALQAIPVGTTRTYASIAAEIGQPTAARAVATACAANRLAIVIPCHRVVRSSGEVSGYRWGSERKRALLQREAATVAE